MRFDECLSGTSRAQLGDSEIEDFNNPVRPDNHILRFDIAMNNSTGMGRSQSAGDLDGNINRGIQFKPAAADFLAQGSRLRQTQKQ